jgi:UDP-glucose 4-epimerase
MINKTLVVGATGRVGQLLARAWGLDGALPCLQHRGAGLDLPGPQVEWHPLSGQALPGKFEAMIVLAGAVRGDLGLNAQLAKACLQAAEAGGVNRVLLASSSAVYGLGENLPESAPTHPVNDYGRAKLQAESVADHYRARGLHVTSLRIGNVAGADALLAGITPDRQVKIDQFPDGKGPIRSYIGPQTLARLLAALLEIPTPPVLNIATPRPVYMADLALAAGADWAYQPAPPTAHQRITLDCALVSRLYSFGECSAADMVAEWNATKGPK